MDEDVSGSDLKDESNRPTTSTSDEKTEIDVSEEDGSSTSDSESAKSEAESSSSNESSADETGSEVAAGLNLPPGESHTITSPSGRRYIAHIFEQSANQNRAPDQAAGGDQDMGEGNMARTLCLNLLNELVKGSYQLIMYKKKKIIEGDEGSDSDEDGKDEKVEKNSNNGEEAGIEDIGEEEEVVSDQDANVSSSESRDTNLCHEQSQIASPELCTIEQNGKVVEVSSSNSATVEPPLKKAKYTWQIKRSGEASTSQMTNNSEANSQLDKNVASSSKNDMEIDDTSVGLHQTHEECAMETNAPDIADTSNASQPQMRLQLNVPKWRPELVQSSYDSCSASVTSSGKECSSESENAEQFTKLKPHPQSTDSVSQSSQRRSVEGDSKTKSSSSVSEACSSSKTDNNDEPSQHQSSTDNEVASLNRLSSQALGNSQNLRDYLTQNGNSYPPHSTNTSLSYVERWQNHHVAKSIVDNAINRTLEEMGLSPAARAAGLNPAQDDQPSSTSYSTERTRIEDVGVAEVIRERGLQQASSGRASSLPTLHAQPSANLMRSLRSEGPSPSACAAAPSPGMTLASQAQRLNPIISRLTEVSENIFVQNVQHGLRLTASVQIVDGGNENAQRDRPGDGDQEHEEHAQIEQDISSTDGQDIRVDSNREEVLSRAVGMTLRIPSAFHSNDADSQSGIPQQASGSSNMSTISSSTEQPPCPDSTSISSIASTFKSVQYTLDDETDNMSIVDSSNKVEHPSLSTNTSSEVESTDMVDKCDTSDAYATLNSANHIMHVDSSIGIDSSCNLADPEVVSDEHLDELRLSALADYEKIENEAPEASFVLDKALSAAISHRGLHFQ